MLFLLPGVVISLITLLARRCYMQPDVGSIPSTTGGTTYSGTHATTEEKQFMDYMSEVGDTVYSGTSRTMGYFMNHPLVTGSIIVGGIGAFLGSRLAYIMAERRRKTTYDRVMENVALFGSMIGSMLSPQARERAVKTISDTGRDMLESGQEFGSAVRERLPLERTSARRTPLERIPLDRIPMMNRFRPEPKPSTIQEIGYALALIPVILALVRNPLVRDMAFPWIANRIRPSRRR